MASSDSSSDDESLEPTPKGVKPRGPFCWAIDGTTEHPAIAMLPQAEIALKRSRGDDNGKVEIQWTNSGFRVWKKLKDIRWEEEAPVAASARSSRRNPTPSKKKQSTPSKRKTTPAKKKVAAATSPSPRKRKATPTGSSRKAGASPRRPISSSSATKKRLAKNEMIPTPGVKRLKGLDGNKRPAPTFLEKVQTTVVSVKDTIVETATGLVDSVKTFYTSNWG